MGLPAGAAVAVSRIAVQPRIGVRSVAQSDAGVDTKRQLTLLTSLSRDARSRAEFIRLAREASVYVSRDS
jgi:hypothetical protein